MKVASLGIAFLLAFADNGGCQTVKGKPMSTTNWGMVKPQSRVTGGTVRPFTVVQIDDFPDDEPGANGFFVTFVSNVTSSGNVNKGPQAGAFYTVEYGSANGTVKTPLMAVNNGETFWFPGSAIRVDAQWSDSASDGNIGAFAVRAIGRFTRHSFSTLFTGIGAGVAITIGDDPVAMAAIPAGARAFRVRGVGLGGAALYPNFDVAGFSGGVAGAPLWSQRYNGGLQGDSAVLPVDGIDTITILNSAAIGTVNITVEWQMDF